MASLSENQKFHYERVHDLYGAHYYDQSALAYRREFMLGPLIDEAGIDLNGCRVAELACGSGYNTLLLQERFPQISCTGFDISSTACSDYRRLTMGEAYEMDLTKPQQVDAYGDAFDAVVIIGGLHHCVTDLPQTLENVAALVRPGGLVLMMEPNARYALEAVRRLWYELDQSFDAATEAALDHSALAASAAKWFRVRHVRYLGGPAFFLIQNSMITRVPVSWKPFLARILFPLERLHARIPGRWGHAFFDAVWERI